MKQNQNLEQDLLESFTSSITIEHGKPWAVKWGRRYTLTTCVKSATEVSRLDFLELFNDLS